MAITVLDNKTVETHRVQFWVPKTPLGNKQKETVTLIDNKIDNCIFDM